MPEQRHDSDEPAAAKVDRSLLSRGRWAWGDWRFSPWLVFVVTLSFEAAFLSGLGSVRQTRHILGLPGSLMALSAVAAGALAGPLIALAASLGGALIYFFTVAGMGSKGDLPATLLSTALWALMGIVSGLLADALRERSRRQREGAVALAQAEARQAAFADLEAGLLPQLPIRHDKLRVATAYRASESRLRLGGDFFDIMNLGGGDLALLIGDVKGHGPAAAALGTRLRAGWQTLILSGASVHATLTSLNSQVLLGAGDGEMFATACLAWVSAEPAGAIIVCAGHPPPLLIGDTVSEVELSPVLPLGIDEPGSWQPTRVTLPDQWTLLFYTDGLIEGREQPGAPARYGIRRLMARLEVADTGPLSSATLERLTDEVERANGGLLADDVAIISVSCNEPSD